MTSLYETALSELEGVFHRLDDAMSTKRSI